MLPAFRISLPKGYCSLAVRLVPEFKTDSLSKLAPDGTATVRLVAEAADIVALAAPKHTTLLAAVVLKLAPVIVTLDPGVPTFGLTPVIVG